MRKTLLVVAAAIASACATPRTPVPLGADDPRPAALLARWNESARAHQALRGRAQLTVDGDVRVRSKQIIVLERPARLRVEVLGLLNQTAAVIVTDGDRYEVLRVGDQSYDTGPVGGDLLWREAHLALTPSEVVELLLGRPILDPELEPAGAVGNVGDDGEWVRLDLVDADQHVLRRLSFDADARLREFEALEPSGRLRWRAKFGDYAPVDGSDFAHSIVLDVTEGGTHVEISLREIELDPELPAGVFRLRRPVESSTAGGRAG